MNFLQWLELNKERNQKNQEVANVVLGDNKFPKSDSFVIMESYLGSKEIEPTVKREFILVFLDWRLHGFQSIVESGNINPNDLQEAITNDAFWQNEVEKGVRRIDKKIFPNGSKKK